MGGDAAALVDTVAVVGERLGSAVAIIVLVIFTLLFLFTGSILVPVKAVLLNLLSLTATFGAIVHVFQDGHLRWLVGDFLVTGTTDTLLPVLMFCIAFGVSMDYEMFLLSRIMEEYRRTGDTTSAVAFGLEQTGRIVHGGRARAGDRDGGDGDLTPHPAEAPGSGPHPRGRARRDPGENAPGSRDHEDGG